VCVSSLGYGADFQDPYEYDFDTDLPLSALTGQDQPSDGAVLAVPVSRDVFEHLPSDQRDGAHSYFCGAQGCYECFSTIEDRTDHEMRAHGQGYLQAFESQLNYDAGNNEMMMPPQDGLDTFDFQQPVVVPEPAPVQRSIDIQPGQTLCHVCDKDYGSSSKLIRHMTAHTGEKPYACSYEGCGKAFTQDSNLKSHMRIHAGEKPYACSYEGCGKAFTQDSNLKSHMRIHAGEKPYACSYQGCGKAFTQDSNLKSHMRIHAGEKPYACSYQGCASRFTLSHHLKNHMTTHTGERPYVCSYEGCGKAFTQSQHLKGHSRIHTGDRPYVCSHQGCHKAFTRSDYLKSHMKIHEQANKPTSSSLSFEQAPDQESAEEEGREE